MRPFERSCLYHPTHGMRVIEESQEEEYKRLLATGVWFDHPNKARDFVPDNQGVPKDEKPIRQRTRKRLKHAEHPSEKTGS